MSGSQTGKGALDLCRQVRPDLILLDIMLPDYDGLEICKAVRKEPDMAMIPIIFLTARASETDRIVGLELGANDYVVKPFFVRELIARIKLAVPQPGRSRAGSGSGRRTIGPQQLPGAPQRHPAKPYRHGVSPSGIPDEPSRGGIQPRTIVERRLGAGPRHHRPGCGCLCSSTAAENRGGPHEPRADSFGSRIRLHLRVARVERYVGCLKALPGQGIYPARTLSCTIVFE